MVLFLVANCLLIPKMYIFCCLKGNFNHWRSKKVKIYLNFQILSNLPVTIKVDLHTTKYVHFWNQRAICNQKNFKFWPSYENFQSSRPWAPDRPKKMKFVSTSHSACKNHGQECRNHIRRVKIKMHVERVEITLVSVKFTPHTCQNYCRVCENLTLRVKSYSACGNRTLCEEINLVRVEITLVRVVITFVRI
jgi:hypothetical protein